jgi:flagellar biosynthetic protein FliP
MSILLLTRLLVVVFYLQPISFIGYSAGAWSEKCGAILKTNSCNTDYRPLSFGKIKSDIGTLGVYRQLDVAGIATGIRSGEHIASFLSSQSIVTEIQKGGSTPWAIVVGLTLLTVLPALLMIMTPLVRILVVFHFLRQALGTQTAPSNQVLMGLALTMTWFLIQPVIRSIDQTAVSPYLAQQISGESAIRSALIPVKQYMLHYARKKDLQLFASMQEGVSLSHPSDLSIVVILPAYIISELKAGFQIGALLFLPFLLVDLVVASVTTSIGMMQLPPVVISTPLKILLFVMVDGWNLLADQLVKSF